MRLPNALMSENVAYGDRNEPTLRLDYGGNFGYAPDIEEWVSNQAYVKRNLIILLLEIPKFMGIMGNSHEWYAGLRALIELHPKSVSGFNAGLEVSVHEQAVGGGGELQQAYTDVKRARTVPVFSWVDKDGNTIQRFLEYWIRFGLMDPDSKVPMATTLDGYKEKDWLADWYAMTIMAIEPNATMESVIRSWITTNMWPMSTGDITGKRDMTTEHEAVEIDITFTGISDTSLGTNICAQAMLDTINAKNANNWLRKCFVSKADTRVNTSKGKVGYKHGLQEIESESISKRQTASGKGGSFTHANAE